MRPSVSRFALALAGTAAGLLAATVAPAQENVELAGLRVTVWEPVASGARPVVLFSHGFHGCSTQSSYLMEAFAGEGYIVFAPNHADATCNGGDANPSDPPEEPFDRPERWSEATYRDRGDDLVRLRDAVAVDPRYAGRVDLSRLGLVGHSLGGYTVLGLSGAWPAWRISGIRAVLALSPYELPYEEFETLDGLAPPVMYQGGTLDLGVTPFLVRSGGGYDQSASPKYLVSFHLVGHFGWTDAADFFAHPEIGDYSLAFLARWVLGEPPAEILEDPAPGVAILRSDLAEAALPRIPVDAGQRDPRTVTRPWP
jgi:dienelactone hydrolase